jgi:hypothetical protein
VVPHDIQWSATPLNFYLRYVPLHNYP